MSRRRSIDQGRGRHAADPARPAQQATPVTAPGAGLRRPTQRLAPHPVYRALLPLRFFLGGMFLYAGLDKLVDPAFLTATGPGSVGEQLAAFTRVSPLTPLIEAFAQPWPVAVGLGMALLEIAIGLGALTGILYRGSAAVGAALSLLFLLTASWDTRPIYYGPDLPYMMGWITLALAGSGGLYVLEDRLLARLREAPLPSALIDDGSPASAGRRAVLEVGALAVATIVVAAAGRAVGRFFGPVFTQQAAATPAPPPSAAPPGPTPATGASGAPAAPSLVTGEIANVNAMPARSSADFVLTSGDPGVVVKLADGKVVAYDATCTHEGCPVGYDTPSGLLLCPCHGAAFDPAADAAVVNGPARRPLASVPISVDPATGAVTLAG